MYTLRYWRYIDTQCGYSFIHHSECWSFYSLNVQGTSSGCVRANLCLEPHEILTALYPLLFFFFNKSYWHKTWDNRLVGQQAWLSYMLHLTWSITFAKRILLHATIQRAERHNISQYDQHYYYNTYQYVISILTVYYQQYSAVIYLTALWLCHFLYFLGGLSLNHLIA